MTFDLTPTAAQHDLAARAPEFAAECIRPAAGHYDRAQEFSWPLLEEAAERGLLFWGCAGIGLAIVMPALVLSAIGQAATPEQMLQWAPECFGTPGDLKLAALAISARSAGSPDWARDSARKSPITTRHASTDTASARRSRRYHDGGTVPDEPTPTGSQVIWTTECTAPLAGSLDPVFERSVLRAAAKHLGATG